MSAQYAISRNRMYPKYVARRCAELLGGRCRMAWFRRAVCRSPAILFSSPPRHPVLSLGLSSLPDVAPSRKGTGLPHTRARIFLSIRFWTPAIVLWVRSLPAFVLCRILSAHTGPANNDIVTHRMSSGIGELRKILIACCRPRASARQHD